MNAVRNRFRWRALRDRGRARGGCSPRYPLAPRWQTARALYLAWPLVSGFLAFVGLLAVLAVTHDTVGWVSIVLLWAGHVTITGAELWQSASDWGFASELSDPRRLGDYQGIGSVGYQIEPILFPALYTFLALQWGAPGWIVIAAIGVLAAVVAHPAAHAAARHARSFAPVT